MRRFLALAFVTATNAVGFSLFAQEAQEATKPVFEQGFEAGMGGIQSVSPVAQLEVTNDPDEVKNGNGALKLTYPANIVNETQAPAVALTELGGRFGALQLWVRASNAIPLGCMATEADGSEYATVVSIPADSWQQVVFDVNDFVQDDKSFDENDQLDGDQVQVLAFCDMSFFLRQIPIPGGAGPAPQGEQVLLADDILVLSQPVRQREQVEGGVLLDDFDSNILRCAFVGDGSLASEPREAGEEENHALLAQYSISQNRPLSIVMFPLPRFEGGIPTGVRFDLKVDFPGTFVIAVQEKGGGNYHYLLGPAPAAEWQTYEVAFNAFVRDDESRDENARLDQDQIGALIFGDASGFMQQFGVNAFWLDNLVITVEP